LKRKVIEHAKQEISTKTGYEIDYTEIKDSRKIVAIEFIIKKRTHFEKHQHEKTSIILKELRSQNILIEKIKEYGFSIPTAKKFLQQESEEVIENALKAVNLQIERGNVKNPKAMIRKAIQGHWKPDVFLSKKDKVKKQLEILNAA
jgi:plasmid replication initiation protein